MSKFLSLEWEPVDQPATKDWVEQRTWCALRIQIGHRRISQLWDRTLQAERSQLYLPAFPIAEWIARNWWALLNEAPRSDLISSSPRDNGQLQWAKRHCLRAADSALLLPRLYLYHDGELLRAEWHADNPCSLPHMAGHFVASGEETLDPTLTRDALSRFVSDMLSRLEKCPDPRVVELEALWNAIQHADHEEQRFCALAGRLGADPYDLTETDEELAEFVERFDQETPLTSDLFEVAQPATVIDQWNWIETVRTRLEFSPKCSLDPVELPARTGLPHEFGYQLARNLRLHISVNPRLPIDSVEETATKITGQPYQWFDYNHVPGRGIRAVVGQHSSGRIIAAGPRPPRPDSGRFLAARGVYSAVVGLSQSQRLITDAFSWNQKASRAFAAEFLAPQQALLDRIASSSVDVATIESLGREFVVSTSVIHRQLQNAGVDLCIE